MGPFVTARCLALYTIPWAHISVYEVGPMMRHIVNMSNPLLVPDPILRVTSCLASIIMGCVCCFARDRDQLDACVQAGGNDVATQQTAPTPLEEEVVPPPVAGPPPGPSASGADWVAPELPPAGRGLAMVRPHFCNR